MATENIYAISDDFKDADVKAVEAFLERFEAADSLPQVISLLDVSARLVETAAYGAARSVDKSAVVDLILIAAQLERKAQEFKALQ